MRKPLVLLLILIAASRAEAQDAGVAGGAFQLFSFHVNTIGSQTFSSPLYAGFADGTLHSLEAQASYPLPSQGRVVSLALNVHENSSDGPIHARVRVNGANTSLVATVPAGFEGVLALAGDAPFGANDLLSVEIDYSQATSGELEITATLHYIVLGSSVSDVPLDRVGLALLGLTIGTAGVILLALRKPAA
jgi:hypothetical protein